MGRAALGAAYLAGGAAVAGLALLRQTGIPAWQTMWAEDGKVFYSQALSMPFLRALVTPHAGYVQLFPRLVAAIAVLAPVRDAPLVVAISGALSLGLLSCLVFHLAQGHVVSPGLRAVLAASMVLLPAASGELLDNAVNVPWWLFFTCFWALLWRPPTRAGNVGAGLLCTLAAASEPLTALFLPLAMLRAVALRRPSDRVNALAQQGAAIGLVVGLLFQLGATLAGGSGGGAVATFRAEDASALAEAISLRVGLGLFAGVKGTNWLAFHEHGLAVALGLLVICLVAAAGLTASSRRVRSFATVAVAGAIVCFVAEAWVRGIWPLLALDRVQDAGRYQAVPLLLLVSSVVVTADGWARSTSPAAHVWAAPRRRGLVAAAMCAALLAPTWAADFRDANARSRGPSWPAAVTVASRRCALIGSPAEVVPIDPPGWTARVSCRRLRGIS
jgi:hypothetical protein